MLNKIYVGNFPYSVSEQDLDQLFSPFGAIESLVIIKDRDTGRSKGFGFITFTSADAMQAALKMDGQDLEGRPLKVNVAKEPERGDRGGSSRQGGGRRRYD